MSNKLYDILKYIALIFVPAICVFITTVGNIWDWQYIDAITGTISAFGVLLGALLQISSINYAKKQEEQEVFEKADEVKNEGGENNG